ncbi:MAG: hypothetical protein GF311_03625, partial [Candidatus Lokiarchaeota archaeon]|nr:hypothetical protein [Candidatus Lokiarchaeota archaeon]
MNEFFDLSSIYKSIKILLLGSYIPENLRVLEKIKNDLKSKGFENTYLGKDLRKNWDNSKNISDIYVKIEKAIQEFDFNIFVLFHNISSPATRFKQENDSTIVELMSLICSGTYSEKRKRTLVFIPQGYISSMLKGVIESKRVNIFEYDNYQQIYKKCPMY